MFLDNEQPVIVVVTDSGLRVVAAAEYAGISGQGSHS